MNKEVINPKVEELIKDDTKDSLVDEVVLCQCFSCKKNYVQSLMKPIKIKKEEEEGYVVCKRYICPDCFDKLERTNWIQEEDFKRKKDEEKE